MDENYSLIKGEHTIVLLAFNAHDITMKALLHIYNNNSDSKILLFDNGSNPSYEKLISNLDIDYHREEENIYVNPAWNKIFDMIETPFLSIINNDFFILSKNYFSFIIPHMKKENIVLSSCKTKNIKLSMLVNFYIYQNKLIEKIFNINNTKFIKNTRRQGWLMTFNLKEYKKLNYKIPDYIKVWFGDDWIWGQVRTHNKIAGVYKNKINNYKMGIHIKSNTTKSKSIKSIINKDIEAIDRYGDWYKKFQIIIHQKYL